MVDGVSRETSSDALTVGGLLQAAGIPQGKLDKVSPASWNLLTDGSTVTVWHAVPVTIQVGGESNTLTSAEITPLAWLQVAGISLAADDRVYVDGSLVDPSAEVPFASQHTLQINPQIPLTLVKDGASRQFQSAAHTIGEALKKEGIQVLAADRLEPSGNTVIRGPMTITLLTARELTITADGQVTSASISADTVGEALTQSGLSLQGLDYSIPAEDQPLPADGRIKVVRVRETVNVITETIPFDVQFQAQADMNLDSQKVIQFGHGGASVTRTRIRLEDGVEVSKTQLVKQVVEDPKPQVVAFGTKITVQTMSTPDGPVEYYRSLDFYATSYYPKMTSPPWYGAVACGGKWKPGYVAVDLHYVPCGTRLYVPGYGFAIAMDTAYISGAWIDLGYPDDAYVIWHRHVTVYFLTPVPPVSQMQWVIPPGSLY